MGSGEGQGTALLQLPPRTSWRCQVTPPADASAWTPPPRPWSRAWGALRSLPLCEELLGEKSLYLCTRVVERRRGRQTEEGFVTLT
jgi:hypothetical protein